MAADRVQRAWRRARLVALLAAAAGLGHGGPAAAQSMRPSGETGARQATMEFPIAPGFYSISAAHSGKCLVAVAGSGTRVARFAQGACSSGRVQLVVGRDGGYALLSSGGDVVGHCATVARGVIAGAASIDALPCGFDGPGFPAEDQLFRLAVFGARDGMPLVELRTMNGECVAVRDASTADFAEVIRFPCNGRDEQRYRLRYTSAPTDQEGRRAAEADWYRQTDAFAPMISIVSTPGIDLLGSDQQPPIVSVDLRTCKRLCALDPRCRALSFVPTAQGAPHCWLKGRLPNPVVNPNVESARVRP